ncbi:MAG: thiamine-phosphate kinase [Verrucomicrobiae bacterium]|nr:thiamine-phosphate kinase [Verrucomicrobiae bacterium]
MRTLRELGEEGWIALLKSRFPSGGDVLAGIGDDCAAVRLPRGAGRKVLLLKTDAVVEGVHFDRRATPFQIGWKAMARPLSDIAAMAGQPRWALVTAALRGNMAARFAREVYQGMTAAAKSFGVAIVGGETVRTAGPFWFSVALIGEVDRRHLRLRSAARIGDAILVTGALGGSIHGKHLTFVPRIAEARWLVEHAPIRAMIDLSDGLARDLGHICRASGVGARLEAPTIPMAPASAGSLHRALNDGEDYELLFTVPASAVRRLRAGWRRKFPVLPLTQIGRIVRGSRITLADAQGNTRPLNESGYDHFRKEP